MTTTFERSPSLFLTSESVTEGHPDKLCDQVSDAVLDAILAQDPEGRVACETSVKTGFVLVFGEITTNARIDVPAIVRQTIKEIGYDSSSAGFDWETCGILSQLLQGLLRIRATGGRCAVQTCCGCGVQPLLPLAHACLYPCFGDGGAKADVDVGRPQRQLFDPGPGLEPGGELLTCESGVFLLGRTHTQGVIPEG